MERIVHAARVSNLRLRKSESSFRPLRARGRAWASKSSISSPPEQMAKNGPNPKKRRSSPKRNSGSERFRCGAGLGLRSRIGKLVSGKMNQFCLCSVLVQTAAKTKATGFVPCMSGFVPNTEAILKLLFWQALLTPIYYHGTPQTPRAS